MEINFAEIADMGFSYFLVMLIGVALARVWPWLKERDDRKFEADRQLDAMRFEATKERERAMMDQSAAFLGAIETFQNGFSATNNAQHLEMIKVLDRMNDRLDRLSVQPVALEK